MFQKYQCQTQFNLQMTSLNLQCFTDFRNDSLGPLFHLSAQRRANQLYMLMVGPTRIFFETRITFGSMFHTRVILHKWQEPQLRLLEWELFQLHFQDPTNSTFYTLVTTCLIIHKILLVFQQLNFTPKPVTLEWKYYHS